MGKPVLFVPVEQILKATSKTSSSLKKISTTHLK